MLVLVINVRATSGGISRRLRLYMKIRARGYGDIAGSFPKRKYNIQQ